MRQPTFIFVKIDHISRADRLAYETVPYQNDVNKSQNTYGIGVV